MKTSIKSSALLVVLALLSTGVFAAGKTTGPTAEKQDVILFSSLSNDFGIAVMVRKANVNTSTVTINDAHGNVIFKDKLAGKNTISRKGYDLSELADGDYTVTVTSNNTVSERVVHIYRDDNDNKLFFFKI